MTTLRTKSRRLPFGPDITGENVVDAVPGSNNTFCVAENVSDDDLSCAFRFWTWHNEYTTNPCVTLTAPASGQLSATAWYTCSGGNGGPGVPNVLTFAFLLTAGDFVPDTPIASVSSGEWPHSGNDRRVGTASEAASIDAKDSIDGETFQNWQIFGAGSAAGDDLDVPQNGSALAVAFYKKTRTDPGLRIPPEIFELIPELADFKDLVGCLGDPACDPSPIDLVRLGRVLGARGGGEPRPPFDNGLGEVMARAGDMEPAQLRAVLTDIKARMARLDSVRGELEGILKKR